jgi:hypothetical protein
MGVQSRPQQAAGNLFNVLNSANEFDAARFAAATGVNLGFPGSFELRIAFRFLGVPSPQFR